MSELFVVVLKIALMYKAAIRAALIASLVFGGDAFAPMRTNANDGLEHASAACQARADDAEQNVTSPSDKPIHIPLEPQSIPFELKDNLLRIEVIVNGQRKIGFWTAVPLHFSSIGAPL